MIEKLSSDHPSIMIKYHKPDVGSNVLVISSDIFTKGTGIKTSNLYIAKITKVNIILFLIVGFSRIDLSFLITFSMNEDYTINLYFFLTVVLFSVVFAFGSAFVVVVFFAITFFSTVLVFAASTFSNVLFSTTFFATGFLVIIFFTFFSIVLYILNHFSDLVPGVANFASAVFENLSIFEKVTFFVSSQSHSIFTKRVSFEIYHRSLSNVLVISVQSTILASASIFERLITL
jgi:hypothetical protein